VADTYAYLARVPETAAILGWEDHIDPVFLKERRRFFTIWLARTLGLDTSDEFACYLFRAGTFHAGHGRGTSMSRPGTSPGRLGCSWPASRARWQMPRWREIPWLEPWRHGASS
jgi:hypothetical protein